ncbi:MAG: HD domain-containing protein [Nitrospirae bacterium]|nr:HD domain-containing protein [Nitrospirota bacterium]
MALPNMENGDRRERLPPRLSEAGDMGLPDGRAGRVRPVDHLATEVMIRCLRDAVLDLDTKGRVRLWSSGAYRLFGYSDAEAMGRPLAELVAVGDAGVGRELAGLLAAAEWPQPERTINSPLRRKDGTLFSGEVTLSSYTASHHRRVMVVVRDHGECRALEVALEASLERERLAMEAYILAIGRMVEARDPYTAGHQQRTARLAKSVALHMGMGAKRAEGIFLGAAVHDIGKIDVPAEILARPTALRSGEREIVQRHPTVGYNIIKDINFPWPVADIVLQHHEHLDGSGYPQGLKGSEITLEARIVVVADVVEAMSSHRPYRPARTMAEALAEINDHRGTYYDPKVVDSCTRLIEQGGNKLEMVAQ